MEMIKNIVTVLLVVCLFTTLVEIAEVLEEHDRIIAKQMEVNASQQRLNDQLMQRIIKLTGER